MKVIGNLTKDAIIRALVSEGSSDTEAVGSESVFESATSNYVVPVYDSNENKTVFFYLDGGNSSYATAIVSTLSGTSLSYGSPVVFNNAPSYYMRAAFDSNSNKIVVVYQDDNSGPGKAIVGTVSGTSISFGTEVTFNASVTTRTSIVFDSNSNKVVITYRDHGNSGYGTGIVGTVSGTSISFGSPTVFESGTVDYVNPCFDSNLNKVVVAYQDFSNSSQGTAVVGTVSGTSISFGTPVVFETGGSSWCASGFDSDTNKVVIGYYDAGNSYYGTAIVGTVSGTSISFGTAVVYQSSQANTYGIVYDNVAKKIIFFYRDQPNSAKGAFISGTVSGTSITFDDKTVVTDGSTEGHGSNATFDSTNRTVVVGFKDESNSNYGTGLAYRVGYTSATGGTIADGKPVIVNANGTVSTVSQTTVSEDTGTGTVFESGSTAWPACAYDSVQNKSLILWSDASASSVGKSAVATISGTSISFGSDVTWASGNRPEYLDAAYDVASGKIVVVYSDGNNSDYGTAVVATISGTSVSFGTPVVFSSSAAGYYTKIVYDPNNEKLVVFYRGSVSGSFKGATNVLTVSGTSVSVGSQVVFSNTDVLWNSPVYDTANQKIVNVFTDNASSPYELLAVVGTVSGTSISFGSVSTIHSDNTEYVSASYDTNTGKILTAYRVTASDQGRARVLTVSGTSVSSGTEATFNAAQTTYINTVYHPLAQKVFISFTKNTSSDNKVIVPATISGTDVTFGSEVTLLSDQSLYGEGVYDSTSKVILVVYRGTSNDRGYASVYQPAYGESNITTENFVGFMDGAALDGTNGEILSSCSIARNQTSLTPGQTYFVTPAGALSTSAGSPSVTAGTTISSTELIVKG